MRIVWVQQLRQGIVFFPAELIKTVSQIFAERDRTGEAANKDDFLDLDVLAQRLKHLLLHNRTNTGQALKKDGPDVVATNTDQYTKEQSNQGMEANYTGITRLPG
jgi:hypothetical protein